MVADDMSDVRLHVDSVGEFAAWLARHHADAEAVWVVTWRAATGRPAPSYATLVVEALRYGWIDSTLRQLDDERTMLRFSPRRPGSGWARSNKERIERLEAEGRLEPAGGAAVEAARADGSWTLLDSVAALEVPADLRAALGELPGAAARWDQLSPSARKAYLFWIVQAKREATRQRRVVETAAKVSRGERLQ
jgi:uncharacterized protein YdeI (YjbR/CyaY-like superfamily)